MISDARKRANAKYDKAHTKGIYLKLNTTTDADIIDYLSRKDNVQGFIKDIIRQNIKSPK